MKLVWVSAALALLVVSSGASAALQPLNTLAILSPSATDPIDAGRELVDTAALLGAVGPDQAARARAALDLASVVARDDVTQGEILSAAVDALASQHAHPDTLASARWTSRMLTATDDAGSPATLDATLALAQILAGDAPILSQREAPSIHHEGLKEALDALLGAYPHAPLTAAQEADVSRVLAAPPETQRALVTLIDALLEARATAILAQEHGDSAMLAMERADVVEAVRKAAPPLAVAPPAIACAPAECSDKTLLICGVIGLDLLGVPTTWPCSVALVVDAGGDDVYRNNAGGAGSSSLTEPGAALALDLAGDDTYRGDTSNGRIPANGAANTGALGALFDLAGNDQYSHDGVDNIWNSFLVVNGAAERGAAALLVDIAGDDTYSHNGRCTGCNGGAVREGSAALLFDAAGDDAYISWGSGLGSAANGASANGAFAALVDLAGDDLYRHTGFVADSSSAANGAAYSFIAPGAGLLVDRGAGNDTYDSEKTAAALGSAIGLGGVGVLADEGGTNTYRALALSSMGSTGVASSAPSNGPLPAPAMGILLAGDGDDDYDAGLVGLQSLFTFPRPPDDMGVTQGAAFQAGLALLADLGGKNAYRANKVTVVDGFAQGVTDRSIGMIVDRGTRADFTLGDGLTGQGSSFGGVGLIVQTRGDTVTNYTAGPLSFPSLTSGGGIGMRLNRGAFSFLGTVPDFHCSAGSLEMVGTDGITVIGQRLIETHVCAPPPGEGEPLPLRNPVTGGSIDSIPGPGIPCRSISPCGETLDDAFGPGPADWLALTQHKTTTSGGLTSVSGDNALHSRYAMVSADDACKVTCAMLEAGNRVG